MTTIILNILCEGQTEEKFVKEVLRSHLPNTVCKTQILETNHKGKQRGGMLSYQQVHRDLTRWMRSVMGRTSETHYFTTMVDFYRLPADFPSYADAMKQPNASAKVATLEAAFGDDIQYTRFIPYIQLHEFEALVFCGLSHLKREYPKAAKEIEKLDSLLQNTYTGNPEDINNSVETAPSKRIIKALEKYYHYNKVKSGVSAVSQVGIDNLRKQCAHFNDWITKLEGLQP